MLLNTKEALVPQHRPGLLAAPLSRIMPVVVVAGKPIPSLINTLHELEEQPALRRTRRERRAPARFDDEDETDQQLRHPPRPPRSPRPPTPLPPPPPIKCALCGESLAQQHFTADDVSRERRCKPLQVLVFTEDKVAKFKEHLSDCNAWQARKTFLRMGIKSCMVASTILSRQQKVIWEQSSSIAAPSDESAIQSSMPMIRRNEGQNITFSSHAIHFRFAVEHDCLKGNCPVRSLRPRKQERQMTSKMAPGVDHVDDENSVINLLSLHNPHLIREVLPPRLTDPRRMFEDREAHIEQVLRKLQIGSDHPTSPSSPSAPLGALAA
ncbi:hypothetical protein IAS59_000981 [Cryptococcus gattii]